MTKPIIVLFILFASIIASGLPIANGKVSKVEQHVFAKGINKSTEDWKPINVTDSFTQVDQYVYAFTNAFYSSTNFTWRWYEPDGKLYWTTSSVFNCRGNSCAFYDRIGISDSDVSSKRVILGNTGQWKMELLADGDLLYADNFTISVIREEATVPILKHPVTIDGVWTSADEWSDANELPIRALNGTTLGYLRIKHDNSSIYILSDIFSKTGLQGSGCDSEIRVLDTVLLDFDFYRAEGISPSPTQLKFAATGDVTRDGKDCYHNIWQGDPNTDWVLISTWGSGSPSHGSFERIASLPSSYDPYSSKVHIVMEAQITLWSLRYGACQLDPSSNLCNLSNLSALSNPIGFAFYFFSQGNPNFPDISWPVGVTTSIPLTWGDLVLHGYMNSSAATTRTTSSYASARSLSSIATSAAPQPLLTNIPESTFILSAAAVITGFILRRKLKRK